MTMQRLELYKSFYDRENSRRENLTNSISIPIGILTVIFSAFTYLVSSFQNDNLLIKLIFYLLAFLCFISNIISIIYLLKSFNNFHKGHEYKELPLVRVMEDYYIELDKYYKEDKEEVSQRFEDFIISELVKYTDINIKFNDQRSLDLFRAKKYIFFSLLCLALICIPTVCFNSNNKIKDKIGLKIQQNQSHIKNSKINNSNDYKLKIFKDE